MPTVENSETKKRRGMDSQASKALQAEQHGRVEVAVQSSASFGTG